MKATLFFISPLKHLKEMNLLYFVQLNETKTHHFLRNEIIFDGKWKKKQSHTGTVTYINSWTIKSSDWILWRLNLVYDLFSLPMCWKRSPERFWFWVEKQGRFTFSIFNDSWISFQSKVVQIWMIISFHEKGFSGCYHCHFKKLYKYVWKWG